MTIAISPTQDQANAALAAFLRAILSVPVIIGQINRVAEPAGSDFVVFWPNRIQRLRTNIDAASDVRFTGSISGTVMTVTAVDFGAIAAGATVFGVGVSANTQVVKQLTGTAGGPGTYTVSVGQTIASRILSSGSKTAEQGMMFTYMIDFHSASTTTAGDMAQTVSTLFRDPFATESFAAQVPVVAVPLYADDPKQSPFFNENQQAEWRWSVEAAIQVDQVVRVPQQYADEVLVDVVSVDAAYPP